MQKYDTKNNKKNTLKLSLHISPLFKTISFNKTNTKYNMITNDRLQYKHTVHYDVTLHNTTQYNTKHR